jgi:hypothetical protein
MGHPVTYQDTNKLGLDIANQKRDIAIHGMVLPDVTTTLACEANTGVYFADQNLTLPSSAIPSSDLLIINTPFIPTKWEMSLDSILPFNKFSDVPIGICFGFDMGITSPPSYTYTPPNHNSALSFQDHIMSYIYEELLAQRYSGPFSSSRLEQLIGIFCTSPLDTVLRSPEEPLDRRIIQDLFSPRNNPLLASVNNQININDFRCNWSTFNNIRTIVIDAPVDTKAATMDVDAAFRCCLISPSQQQNFVIH